MTPAPSNSSGTLVLVPARRFFLTELALDAAAGAAGQVELRLEETSPFPLAQMYHGFVASPDRTRALGYAAYRRRFTAEETAAWAGAGAVVPSVFALLGPPPSQPEIVVHLHDGTLSGVAWDGKSAWPVAVMTQAVGGPDEAALAGLVEELRRRCDLADAGVRQLQGPVTASRDDDGDAIFHIDGRETARLPGAALADADVRDKSFLEERRQQENESRGWGRALAATLVVVLLALGLELLAGATAIWNQRRRATVEAQAEAVRRIETAQTVATRVEDLAARPVRPFEWLALASAARPRSIQFVRIASRPGLALEIDAQTANAADVATYEAALRRLEGLESVETRDLRSREGLATFTVALKFKPGLPAVAVAKGGQP
ncbi:MAG: hypothetical protein JWQ62_2110 [Lacunisphaera sp.]|nr:hypothetical protein [Lacunisphaera sp.]